MYSQHLQLLLQSSRLVLNMHRYRSHTDLPWEASRSDTSAMPDGAIPLTSIVGLEASAIVTLDPALAHATGTIQSIRHSYTSLSIR
jgi:hypothetical protein